MAKFSNTLLSWPIAAYLGALTYATTVSFGYGTAAHWGVPLDVVTFTKENAFQAVLLIAFFGGMAWWMFPRDIDACKLPRWRVGSSIAFFLCVLIVGLQEIVRLFSIQTGLLLCVISLFSVVLIVASVEPTILRNNWFREQLSPEEFKIGAVLFGAFPIVPIVAATLGGFIAQWQVSFIVLHDDPEMVVLLDQGTNVVCARLRRGKGEENPSIIEKRFRVVSLAAADAPSFEKEELGHLKVVSTEEFNRMEHTSRSEFPR